MNQLRFPKQPTLNKVLEVGGKRERVPVHDGSQDSMPVREQKRLLEQWQQIFQALGFVHGFPRALSCVHEPRPNRRVAVERWLSPHTLNLMCTTSPSCTR